MAEAIARVDRLFYSQAKFTRKMLLRAAKNLSKKIWLVFRILSQKIGQIIVFSYKIMSKKQGNTFLMFVIVTEAAKNLWRVAVGHAWA